MKYIILLLLISLSPLAAQGQIESPTEKVVITTKMQKTNVRTDENGILIVSVSPKNLSKFQKRGFVRYSEFGAKGNGRNDDIEAIAATHAFANEYDLSVKADKKSIYYIGAKERIVIIQTETEFGTAEFVIDDTNVQNRDAPIFSVRSKLQSITPTGLTSLKRNQSHINIQLPGPSLISVTDSNTKRYIRMGLNQNSGAAQTDIFVVDQNGLVDKNTPILWDFDQITEITALPIDNNVLTITGGKFTTIANKEKAKFTYFKRNIEIKRSNVIVNRLEHHIIEEGEHGAPYGGFIHIQDCSNVTIKNTILTGHKTYSKIGSAGQPVKMGTYDILVTRASNVSFVNCTQTNDINDRTYWGIMGSNYSKNILFDSCTLSRFDAHMGVANATIRNSTLGHMGVNAIGSGLLTIEGSTIHGWNLINLRRDYGSTWQGKFIIRNCVFVPAGNNPRSVTVIGGTNFGQHNFGYTCYMPEEITIENLYIDDSNHPENYDGPAIFNDFNPQMKDSSYHEEFPYVTTQRLSLKNVTTASGKKPRLSENQFQFRNLNAKIY